MAYRVSRRQATYWDIADQQRAIRIHFEGKREFSYVDGGFDRWEVLSCHSLLHEHQRDWLRLFLGRVSQKNDPALVVAEMAAEIERSQQGSRPASRYLNEFGVERILRDGGGLIMEGPDIAVDAAYDVLQRSGYKVTVHSGRRGCAAAKLLRLGNSFVIADGFRVDAAA